MASQKPNKGVKMLKIEEKATILAWAEEGVSVKEIASRMGRHRSAIHRVVAKAKSLPKFAIPSRKKGSGRPRKLTSLVLGVMRRQIQKYPGATAADLKTTCPELAHLAERTISHALQKHLKMPSRVAAMKPLLSVKMKKKRLQFAKKHKDWSAADWSKVMYSDESTFRCIRATRSKVRRPSGSNRFDSRFTVKTVKHPDSVMVWGCFSAVGGHGGLFFLPRNTTMNGERYQEVLQKHLLPSMESHGCTHFLQDGAPCHASKRIKAFLADKPFELIDWPGNSPDLNPIENAWNYMKNALKNEDISSVPRLTEAIKTLWTTNLGKEYFSSLSNYMPKRMQDVINAGRDMTKPC